ncbi:hypothetical protein AgCh_009537 [Apium graveolens]
MEIEFLELKQDYVHSEIQRARRFQQGLKPEIHNGVVVLQLKTYPSIVQAALVIEFDQKLAAREKEDKKRKIDDVEGASSQEGSSQKDQEKVGRNKNKKLRGQSFSLNMISNTSVNSNQAKSVKSPISECLERRDIMRQNVRWKIQESSITTVARWGMFPRTVSTSRDSMGGSASKGLTSSTPKAKTYNKSKGLTSQDPDKEPGK